MAPLPKRRHSTKRGGTRVAAKKLAAVAFVACPNCHAPILPHRACRACGYFRGTVIRNVKAKKSKE